MQCYHYNKSVTPRKWALYTFQDIMGGFADIRGIPESMLCANARGLRQTHKKSRNYVRPF